MRLRVSSIPIRIAFDHRTKEINMQEAQTGRTKRLLVRPHAYGIPQRRRYPYALTVGITPRSAMPRAVDCIWLCSMQLADAGFPPCKLQAGCLIIRNIEVEAPNTTSLTCTYTMLYGRAEAQAHT